MIQVGTLTEKLQSNSETSQENKEMQSRVASLSIEKEELQLSLETLRQEKQQLTAELENRMETVCVCASVCSVKSSGIINFIFNY